MKSFKYLFFSLVIMAVSCSSTENLQDFNQFNYEVSCDYVGKEGTQALVVSTIHESADQGLSLARLQGVHAILAKGVNSGTCNVPPLVDRDTYYDNEQYFNAFFESEEYLRFVVSASDSPIDMFYVGNQVKVSSDVTIDRNGLRSYLINDGVIKNLGNVF